MAYQLFVKGKEVVPSIGTFITDVSQYTTEGTTTLSGTSLTGATLTQGTTGTPSTTWTQRLIVTIPNLIVGQSYNYSFTLNSSVGTSYVAFSIRTNGLDYVSGDAGVLDYSTSPLSVSSTFIATQTTAVMVFRPFFVEPTGTTLILSSLLVVGWTESFNGITELDILKGSPFTLDFNFKDIKTLKPKGSHSYNFRLPSSPSNDQFFGSYYKVGSYYSDDNFSYNPFGMAECYVLKDTIEVFKGNMQLTNIYLKDKNRYEYECILFSPEVGFLDLIKGAKFKELDYSEWNHELTVSNVYDSYNSESIDSGNIVWSLWDYGMGVASSAYMSYFQSSVTNSDDWNTFSFNAKHLRPQVKLKALIDKVFAITGYTYTSELFDSAEFQKIYMDLNYNKTNVVTTEIVLDAFNTQVVNNSSQSISNSDPLPQRVVTFPTEISDESNQWSGGTWTPQATGTYQITISGTITPSVVPSFIYGTSFSLGGGTPDYLDFSDLEISATGAASSFSQTITIIVSDLSDYFNITLWGSIYNAGVDWVLTDMDLKIQPTEINSDITNIVYINNLFGELSIEKWWKSIMTKFNLVMIPNKNNPTELLVEPYNDYVDTGVAIDWSDKVDYTKDVQIIPPTKYSGKQVKFKDAQSNDYVYQSIKRNPFNEDEQTYGEYIEPGVKNKFADKDTEFTSIFVPTINYPLNNSTNNLGVYSCAIWNTNADGAKENTGGVRLSFFHGTKPLIGGFVYNLSTGNEFSGVDNQYSNYPFFSAYSEKDFTDGSDVWTLNWAETLSSAPQDWDVLPSFGMARKFWSDYVLDNFNVNSRMLSAYIRLTPKDIADFSFADTIQLMGHNYRVNSIKGYPVSSSGNARVELLLVNKSNYIPTSLINQTGGIITGENQVDCDWIYHSLAPNTGLVLFTTSLSSTPTTGISETCCLAKGFQWLPNSNSLYGCYLPAGTPLPGEENDRNAAGNILTNTTNTINGTNNTTGGDYNSITGNGNTIKGNSFNNKIEGNTNEIGRTVRNSFIYGSNNNIDTYQFSDVVFGESLNYNTSIIGGRLSGDYGRILITGDDVISNGTSIKGVAQKGNFVLNAVSDGDILIGQYGKFSYSDDYNSAANQNGIRFAGKSNIKLTIEAVGINQSPSNQSYKEKAIITQTVMLSNYTSPVVIYNNVDSSVVDTVFGTTTIEVLPLSKPPYYNSNGGGFVCIKLATNSIDANWTFNIKYETTLLNNLVSPAILDPTVITGCKLWLDASNFASVTGVDVSQWNDLSGGENRVTQSDAAFKPEYKFDDWHRPYLDFADTNMNTTDADLLALANGNNTFIAVYKSDITTAEDYGQVIMGCINSDASPNVGLRVNASRGTGASGSDSISYSSQLNDTSVNACNIPTATVTNLSIAVGTRTGTDTKIWDGNGLTGTGTTGADNTNVTYFSVGAATNTGTTDSFEFDGKIHELICYNVAITDSEVQKVISYLKNKWDIV